MKEASKEEIWEFLNLKNAFLKILGGLPTQPTGKGNKPILELPE